MHIDDIILMTQTKNVILLSTFESDAQSPHTRRGGTPVTPLSPSLSARIPPELIDRFIDHLHSNSQALAACSTVCKVWLPASRYHLFALVKISRRNATEFFESLNSPTSTLRSAIRGLSIRECRPGEYVSIREFRFDQIIPRLTGFIFIERVELFPRRLESMEFIVPWLAEHSRTLTELTIDSGMYGGGFLSFVQFLETISAIPQLRCIKLIDISWIADTIPPVGKYCVPAHLKSLVIKNSSHLELIDWLLCHNPLPEIQYVDVRAVYITKRETVARFYRTLGPSLEHLDIYYIPQADLSYNTNLRTLRLCNVALYRIRGDWPTTVLAQIRSTHVEVIVLEIYLHALDQVDAIDWVHFEQILQHPRFAGLRRLAFALESKSRHGQVAERIRAKLPLCEARGILQFSQGPRVDSQHRLRYGFP